MRCHPVASTLQLDGGNDLRADARAAALLEVFDHILEACSGGPPDEGDVDEEAIVFMRRGRQHSPVPEAKAHISDERLTLSCVLALFEAMPSAGALSHGASAAATGAALRAAVGDLGPHADH